MKKKNIDIIAGARPNFMKVAALFAVQDQFPSLNLRLIHTGQHYDPLMSDVFLREFNLPTPTCSLEVGSASHAVQTAEIMKAYEKLVLNDRPDMCLVVGDVNSTIACALVATKLGIPVAHVEAGLRSFDSTMPEEINRILTDSISKLLFVTEPSGLVNLKKEGHADNKIHHVGHVMIDTLLQMKPKAEKLQPYEKFSVQEKDYAFITLHRPSNVDDAKKLQDIISQLLWLAKQMPIIFPVHPRTKKNLLSMDLYNSLQSTENIYLLDPASYLESLAWMTNAKVVVTDSGGIQEETTMLKIPCLTLRENTERPVTITQGTNTLISNNWELFRSCIEKINNNEYIKNSEQIKYWDGQAGERILSAIDRYVH